MLRLYLGNGAGGFQTGTGNTFGGSGWNNMANIFSSGDFNGDGKPDVIARDPSVGMLRLYLGNGAGGFQTGTGNTFGGGGWNNMANIF
jgi:hypothetical protein